MQSIYRTTKEIHINLLCQCRGSLVDKQFGSKADRIYCGPCYDAQFASRCDACGDVFKVIHQNIELARKLQSYTNWKLRPTD